MYFVYTFYTYAYDFLPKFKVLTEIQCSFKFSYVKTVRNYRGPYYFSLEDRDNFRVNKMTPF